MALVCVQPLLVGQARQREDYTSDKRGVAVIMAVMRTSAPAAAAAAASPAKSRSAAPTAAPTKAHSAPAT